MGSDQEAAVTIERLYELRARVEIADDSWFDALARGDSGADEKAAHKAALAEYRAAEREAINARVTEACWKCGGRKTVDYGRVFLDKRTRQGVHTDRWCFACGGSGRQYVRKHRFSATAPTRLRKKREAEAARAAEEREADERFAAFAAENEEVARFLTERAGEDSFVSDMVTSVRVYGGLTERQAEVVAEKMERERAERERQERLKEAGPYPVGAATVEAEVVNVQSRESRYSYGHEWKMLVVLDSGHKAWGSVPEALWQAANELTDAEREKGREVQYGPDDLRIRFTANFSQGDSADFGFFKRPRKIEVLGVRESVAA